MKGRLYIYALFVLAVLTGCRKQIVPDDVPVLPEESQEMVINVKSDVPDPKFTFLFWHQEDFVRGLKNENQGLAQPYHIAEPTGNIGDYEYKVGTTEATSQDNDYNTGRIYPENYGVAVCTGYGPYTGVVPSKDNSGMTDYSTLDITNPPGTTDVLVAQNFLEGSSLFPFSGNLEFFHPQIQLTVYATLASTMTKYIKDVSFSVDKDNLLSSLAWNAGVKGYRPSGERPANGWTSRILTDHINSSDKKPIGKVNVVPQPHEGWEMKSVDITVTGNIGNVIDGTYSPFAMTVPVAFKDSSDNDLTLELNDSYEILLIFDEDQIEITAVKVPWEEGGNVLVPIHPIPAD